MKRLLVLPLFVLLIAIGCARRSESPQQPPSPPSSVSVTVTPGSVTVNIGDTRQFTATVTGTPNPAVTWSVSGTSCTGGDCGGISGTGLYTAPDALPSGSVTVRAVSVADTSRSATAAVNITDSLSLNPGDQYAFLFHGFEPGAGTVACAGTFRIGPGGTITDGVADINAQSGVIENQAFSGTYTLGSDNRGRMILPTPLGTFRYVLNQTTGLGRFIAFESTGIRGSGVIKRQDPAAFSRAAFNGNFAFGFVGAVFSGTRAAATGSVSLNSGPGTVTNGSMDANLGGSGISETLTPDFYNVFPSGRGTATLNSPSMGMLRFRFHIVSTTEAFFVNIDERTPTLPALGGITLKQSGPFSPASLSGSLVFNLSAVVLAGSRVTIGRVTADGSGNLTGGLYDENSGGVISPPGGVSFGGSYDVAAGASGRGTITSFQGNPYVFYMVDTNRAFLMQAAGVEAGAGLLEPQSGTAAPNGRYFNGTITPAACGCRGVAGRADLTGASGNITGTQTRSEAGGIVAPDILTGTSQAPSVQGRGTARTTSPLTENFVFYVVSPSKFVLVNVDGATTNPVVTIFEQ